MMIWYWTFGVLVTALFWGLIIWAVAYLWGLGRRRRPGPAGQGQPWSGGSPHAGDEPFAVRGEAFVLGAQRLDELPLLGADADHQPDPAEDRHRGQAEHAPAGQREAGQGQR